MADKAKRYLLLSCLLLSFVWLPAQTIRFEEAPRAISPSVVGKLKTEFTAFKILELDMAALAVKTKSTKISISIPGMKSMDFQGGHNQNIFDKTNVTIRSGGGFQKGLSQPMVHFSGKSAFGTDHLALSTGTDFLLASFESEGRKFFVEQLSNLIPGQSSSVFVLYTDSDVITQKGACGNTAASAISSAKQQNSQERIASAGLPRTVELALAADYTTYVNHGLNVNNVTAYISSVVNLMQTFYFDTFTNDLTFQITEIVVFTSSTNNPWTSTNSIATNLTNFNSWGTTGFSKPFDLSQYWFTTPNFDFSDAVGLAYQPSACTHAGNSAIREYNAPLSSMQVVVAHEIGHTLSAPHDPLGTNYIMSLGANGANTWSPNSVSQINSYLASGSASCITTPQLVISSNTSGAVCPGTTIVFTAAIASDGSAPVYQWKVNGANVGSNSTQYSTSGLVSGDFVSCILSTFISGNPITYTSNNFLSPVVTIPKITGSLNFSFCEGNTVTLQSTAANSNQWYRDGVAIPGATNATLIVSGSGSYAVKIVLGTCESSLSAPAVINVYPNTTPVLSADTPVICGSGIVNLTCNTSGNTFTWYKNNVLFNTTPSPYQAVSSAGSYTVKTGCSLTFSNPVVVTVNAVPATPVVTAGGPIVFCEGSNVTLSSNAANNNQWLKSGSPIVGANNATLTVTNTGAYSVQVIQAGCTSPTSNTVTVSVHAVPAKPSISVSDGLPPSICSGNSIALIATDIFADHQWYKDGVPVGSNSTLLTVTTAGAFTVTSTITGCVSLLSTAMVVTATPNPPTPTISGSLTACGTFTTLTSSASSGNQWYQNNSPVNGATGTTFNASATGDYAVKVTSGGCSSFSANVAVVISSRPSSPTISNASTTTFCQGGTVQLYDNVNDSGYDIQWYKNGSPIPGGTTSFIASTTGNYAMTIAHLGCESTPSNVITVTVNPIPPTPTVTAGSAVTFCSGGSVVLTSSAAGGNQWYKDGSIIIGATNSTYTSSASGNYTTKVTLSGCVSGVSNAIAVTTNPSPASAIITAGSGTTFCSGGNVVLTSNTANGNQWYKDGVILAGSVNSTYAVTATGSYISKITSNGCTSASSNSIMVTVNPSPPTPTLSAGSATTFCQGGSVVLTSSAANGNQWYKDGSVINGATNSTYTSSASGNYTTKVTLSGCVSGVSNAIAVTTNPGPASAIITAGSATTFCSGDNVVLTSNTANGNQWYKDGVILAGSVNSTYAVTATGSYISKITSNGCTSASSNSIMVTVNPSPPTPTLSAGSPTTFCQGGSVVLTSSAANGNQWYKDGSVINGATNSTYTSSASGNYTTKVTLSGCASGVSNAIAVTTNPGPASAVVTAGPVLTFCSGGNVVLTSSSAVGNQWYKDGVIISGAANQTYAATVTGSYTSKVILNGCTSSNSNSIVVTVNAIPSTPGASAGSATTFCLGGSVLITSSEVSGNQWYKDGVIISGSTLSTYSANATGLYTTKVTLNGCSSGVSNGVAVTVNALPATPIVSAGSALAFCQGGSVLLTSNLSLGNQWYKNGAIISGATTSTYTASATGNYTTKVTANGCISNASNGLIVTANPIPSPPTIIAGSATTFCQGETVTLTSGAGSGNQWYVDGAVVSGSTGSTYTVSVSGIYTAIVTQNGCVSGVSNSISVSVMPAPPAPTINAASAVSFCAGESVNLMSTEDSGNTWYQGNVVISNLPTVIISQSGTYTATVIEDGCQSAHSNSIVVTAFPIPPKPVIIKEDEDLVSSSANGDQWYKEGIVVAGAIQQHFTPVLSGNYSVQVTENDCVSEMSDIFNFIITGTSDPVYNVGNIQLYPNPVEDRLFFGKIPTNVTIRIYDIMGTEVVALTQENIREMNVAHLAQAVYIVLITDSQSNEIARRTIVKK